MLGSLVPMNALRQKGVAYPIPKLYGVGDSLLSCLVDELMSSIRLIDIARF
jgi:hypothetical protein